MDITCTPHGYQMHTTWVSDAHHMGIKCTSHGYHMHTTWVSHAHHMGITWHAQHMSITCIPHGYHMHTTWVSHAHHIGITCTQHGYHIHTTWVSHALALCFCIILSRAVLPWNKCCYICLMSFFLGSICVFSSMIMKSNTNLNSHWCSRQDHPPLPHPPAPTSCICSFICLMSFSLGSICFFSSLIL